VSSRFVKYIQLHGVPYCGIFALEVPDKPLSKARLTDESVWCRPEFWRGWVDLRDGNMNIYQGRRWLGWLTLREAISREEIWQMPILIWDGLFQESLKKTNRSAILFLAVSSTAPDILAYTLVLVVDDTGAYWPPFMKEV